MQSEHHESNADFGDPTIPDSETLSLGSIDIERALEKDEATKFTAPENMLRYTVTVEPIEEPCNREGCEGVPKHDGYCSVACLEADSDE